MNYKNYWSNQKSSGHRRTDNLFFEKKAAEHMHILGADAKIPSLDIGCGAGELLEHLVKDVDIHEALDHSESMLKEAIFRLGNSKISFTNADTLSYLKNCELPVWMACQSINQYLNAEDQLKILDHFEANNHVKSLYLFDTICPSRYLLWNRTFVLDFIGLERKFKYIRRIYGFGLGLIMAIFAPKKLEYTKMREIAMGYAFSPGFFIREAKKRNLQIEVVNSLYYEYRYHIIIKKIIS